MIRFSISKKTTDVPWHMHYIPIVIPVYNPPDQFGPFVRNLRRMTDEPIIIINDGSHDRFIRHFALLSKLTRTTILTHQTNKGKGAALKTAMHHLVRAMPRALGIITADADGQHVPSDILVCEQLAKNKQSSLIIGTRVSRKNMPLKSRAGNAITRSVLHLLHNRRINDTQSGLRYIPLPLIKDCLSSIFNKYDFELDMLIRASRAKIPIIEFPIETIYLNNNRASHYKAFTDSWYVANVFMHYAKK